jgi:Homing endonuclease associated repeat
MRGVKILMSKEQILSTIKQVAEQLGRAPTREELEQLGGIAPPVVRRVFVRHTSAMRAAGLEPAPTGPPQRISNEQLLEDWGRVARRLGKAPTQKEYQIEGQHSDKLMADRFGRWSAVREQFVRAQAKGALGVEWNDVVEMARNAPVPGKTRQRMLMRKLMGPARRGRWMTRAGGEALPPGLPPPLADRKCVTATMLPVLVASILLGGGFLRQVLKDRPVLGPPMHTATLAHEPVNEMGVSMLFAMVARELGFVIEQVQTAFPDCRAKMEVAPGRWQEVRIEFEYESRSFAAHGHDAKGCDMIVCWRHNWKACPKEMMVVELRRIGRSGDREIG